MERYKVTYFKYDDPDVLAEKLKSIMEEYDMYLIGIDENRYKFDKDRSYSRSFTIDAVPNGWIAVIDDEISQSEELSQELSEGLACGALCIGILNDVLYYTIFENGEQTGQYMSSLKNYEYEIDDDIINMYKGDAEVFKPVIGDKDIEKLQELLDSCRNGEIDSEDIFRSILVVLGIIPVEEEDAGDDEAEKEEEEQDGKPIVNPDLFYVDFECINIRTDDRNEIIDAIEKISGDFGFSKVDDFRSEDGMKKGFLKKMLNSISESKRLMFFISPSSDGWVTLCGELESLRGNEPLDWSFVHIEDRLSDVTGKMAVNISANTECWGFKIFRDGKMICSYNSNDEEYNIDTIVEALPYISNEQIADILGKQLNTAMDINSNLEEFCGALGIDNFKINIPMDFSEEEYYETVINKLPGSNDFISMKFAENR